MTHKFILTVLIFVLFPLTLHAQTTCSSEVSYTWKKSGEETDKPEYWALVERSAADEVQAKAKLAEATAREKVRAAEACRQRHEGLADCVAGKFQTMSSVLASLDFTSRNKLQAAIHTDCAEQQGMCKETKIGEPQCVTIEAKKDEKKKDEGAEGKKGKKK